MLLDNRYANDSYSPISRTDAAGNTYQQRRLENGAEFEIIKNIPTSDELTSCIVAAGGNKPIIQETTYYWFAHYTVASHELPG